MPLYRYTGPPGMYPQGRDTHDHPIGTVDTGDVRDLSEPPDTSWVPLESLEAIRWQYAEAAVTASQDDDAEPEPPGHDGEDQPDPGQPGGEQDHDDTAGDGQEEG